jgi:N6-adenosine-specific RNA methylase IME4
MLQLPTREQVRRAVPVPDIDGIRQRLAKAGTLEEVAQIDNELSAAEAFMRESGLYDPEEIRPLNETRMQARWKLGGLLARIERKPGGRGKKALTGLGVLLEKIGLTDPVAIQAQRISHLPENELEKVLVRCHKEGDLCTFRELIVAARPWWYKESRHRKHKEIQASAIGKKYPLGPFPLIYADPPWRFEVYSEKGRGRTADQHYPTLTYEEIANFKIGEKLVEEIAGKRAALFLWCTSSNIPQALDIMDAWGFAFKSSAVWVKDRSGTGLVFRNKHELLLYGTKGNMPGPQFQPPSVFECPRSRHSAKPPEVRKIIERMYPSFSRKTRLELFSRDQVNGWTGYGHEA